MGYKVESANEYVREVTAKYIGPRRKSFAFTRAEQVAAFIRSAMRDEAREHFFALYLDGSNCLASYSLVAIGSANRVGIHPREVFQGAILSGACAIIVGHNHPSGSLEPSDEDRSVTRALCSAGKILGISVLDHVIVSREGFCSFDTLGLMPPK